MMNIFIVFSFLKSGNCLQWRFQIAVQTTCRWPESGRVTIGSSQIGRVFTNGQRNPLVDRTAKSVFFFSSADRPHLPVILRFDPLWGWILFLIGGSKNSMKTKFILRVRFRCVCFFYSMHQENVAGAEGGGRKARLKRALWALSAPISGLKSAQHCSSRRYSSQGPLFFGRNRRFCFEHF